MAEKKVAWRHNAVSSDDATSPEPEPLDLSAEVRAGVRNKMLICPVCAKPLMYRIISAVKMDAVCPGCRAAVLVFKPNFDERIAGGRSTGVAAVSRDFVRYIREKYSPRYP